MHQNDLTQLITLNGDDWYTHNWSMDKQQCTNTIEVGNILFFPELTFTLSEMERALLDPKLTDPKHKNISLTPDTHQLIGFKGNTEQTAIAYEMIKRYQYQAQMLVFNLFPYYRKKLRLAPTSLRLHRVETRKTSWRQDDTRLHIDAFPSRPNHGERILRVFANISPNKEPRVWRVGARFEKIAQQFLHLTKRLPPGIPWIMYRLGITKQLRSHYDQIMLQLHDAMKRDNEYQRHGIQCTVPFPADCVWICYSDQVPHAVMSGQFMLEQTYFLSPNNMVYPEYAPLNVLTRIHQKKLI